MESTPNTSARAIANDHCDDLAAKRAELQKWVNTRMENNLDQHSKEWIEDKQYRVGGSTISTFMGLNYFKSISDLILEKTGQNEFHANSSMHHGNLFEELIKQYMEMVYDCKILGEDLYMVKGDHLCYSPDGLCVIKLAPDAPPMTVLMEFKCPASRKPTKTPPKQYVPQVQMGLEFCDNADIGMLVEAVFKRRKTVAKTSLASGVIGLHKPLDPICQTCGADEKHAKPSRIEVKDYSVADDKTYEAFLAEIDAGVYQKWYGTMKGNQNTFSDFIDFCKHNNSVPMAIIEYDLESVQTHIIKRAPGFLDALTPVVEHTMSCIQQCNKIEDANEKRKKIVELFPQFGSVDVE